jgi:hypothetical protein
LKEVNAQQMYNSSQAKVGLQMSLIAYTFAKPLSLLARKRSRFSLAAE